MNMSDQSPVQDFLTDEEVGTSGSDTQVLDAELSLTETVQGSQESPADGDFVQESASGDTSAQDSTADESAADDNPAQDLQEDGTMSVTPVMQLTDFGSVQNAATGDDAVPMDILGCTAAESCKGLYSSDDIMQAAGELYDKHGHLEFKAAELANMLNEKQSEKDQASMKTVYFPLVIDSGHSDGGHVIEIKRCDECASQGEHPTVKWIPPMERNYTL